MSRYSTWEDPFRPLDPIVASVAEAWFKVDGIEAEGGYPVGLLVGEQPGPRSNPRLPLWPYPPRSAGGRLHAMSGLPIREYLLRLARVNILRQPGRWDAHDAANRVRRLVTDLPSGARVVLVGARARDAVMGHPPGPWPWFDRQPLANLEMVAIPHPSGINQAYNDPAVVARAREAVRWAARWEG